MPTGKKHEYPKEVGTGAVKVRICRSRNKRGYTSYFVNYTLKGRQITKSFSNPKEADKEANNIKTQIETGDQSGLFLRGEDRVLYQRALSIVEPLGIALDTAVRVYVDARAIHTGSATVMEACREYARRHSTVTQKILVSDAVTKLIEIEVAEQGSSASKRG